MPFDNDTRDGRGYYDEGTGMRVRVTGTQSPVEVPIKPPVSFTQSPFSKVS